MTKETWTKLAMDGAAALFLAFLLLLVVRVFGGNLSSLTFSSLGLAPRVAGGTALGTASNTPGTAGDTGGEGTAWASTIPATTDSYYGYNYFPPNMVPAGIAPNPLAPSSTQAIGGAVGQYSGCSTCGG